jgi:hypothetical protein
VGRSRAGEQELADGADEDGVAGLDRVVAGNEVLGGGALLSAVTTTLRRWDDEPEQVAPLTEVAVPDALTGWEPLIPPSSTTSGESTELDMVDHPESRPASADLLRAAGLNSP